MPKVAYVEKKFQAASMKLIEHADAIIVEYQAQGLTLTLRQLYYQFVSRDLLPNRQQSYSNLGSLINDARLAGLIDWEAIEDRTRNLKANSHWDAPGEIINSAARSYMRDRWADQPRRVEVWIEKEALAGVLEDACAELDVAFFACRGYTSVSELWRAGMRLKNYARNKQTPIVIHLGDHDPSGIDMTRDIEDRLSLFLGKYADDLVVRRIALNMDQVEQYNPPPNPAKSTDSRFREYQIRHGDESWELDALDPATLVGLVRSVVKEYTAPLAMKKMIQRESQERGSLTKASERWDDVVTYLNNGHE